jgi:ankyrin repeat protein
VTLAISKGATPGAQASNGGNPLHRAIFAEHIEILDALLAAGADTAAVDDKGRNALHLASSHKGLRTLTVYWHSRKKEHMATAILRQDGVQVNGRTAGGDTALYLAAATGDEMLVMALLKHGASVDIRNRAGRTPLHSAVSGWAFPGIVERLLWHGASPRAVDAQGRTAAHLIRIRNPKGLEVLNLLVEHGADAAAAARNGDRPAHCAVRRNNWALVKRLLEVGASVSDEGALRRTVLHVAARRGHAAMIGPLVAMGADVGALDADGWTPMRHAREKNRVEVMDALHRAEISAHDLFCGATQRPRTVA